MATVSSPEGRDLLEPDILADDIADDISMGSPADVVAATTATSGVPSLAAPHPTPTRSLAAPVPTRRAQLQSNGRPDAQGKTELESDSARSLSPEPLLSQSVPADAAGSGAFFLRRGRAASNSSNLLNELGAGLGLSLHEGDSAGGGGEHGAGASDVLMHDYFEPSRSVGPGAVSSGAAALPHSLTFNSLHSAHSVAQQQQGPSAAIPIHPTSHSLLGVPGLNVGRNRYASQLGPSSLSTSPASSFSGGLSASPGLASSATPPQPGGSGSASAAPSPQRAGPGSSPAPPVPRSWSFIERGRRLFGGGGSSNDASDTAAAALPQRRSSAIVMQPREASLGIGANEVLASSWSGSGVSHVPLPSHFAAANAATVAAASTRGRSQSHAAPPSSALAAQATAAAGAAAAAAAAAAASPARLLQSSPLIPGPTKAALSRLEEYVREVARTVDDYKQLLVRLRARRRQVLGTLSSSMQRLGSWMQVGKLEVLQELQTLQADLFDREETMLRAACVVLKERAAALAEAQEDAQEQLIHLLHSTQPPGSLAPVSLKKLSAEQKALQARMLLLPPRSLMDTLAAQTPKQFALTHPVLVPHSAEHRALAARLEACKARYLAVARATDVEELEDRKTRVQRVVAALEQRCAIHPPPPSPVHPQSPEDAAAAAAATLAFAAAAAAAARESSAPPPPLQLDYAPARDIELEFAKLVLDERSKEGRAVARFVADLEAAVSASKGAVVASSSSGETNSTARESTHSGSATPTPPPASQPPHAISQGQGQGDLSTLSLAEAAQAPGSLVGSSVAPSLESLSGLCFDSISAFLTQLEHSCARDYAILPALRPVLRLLVQRTIFPRIWHLVLQLGYEKEDLRCLPPVAGEEQEEAETDGEQGRAGPPTPRLVDMAAREEQLQRQLQWLRTVSPLDLGIPITFLKPAPPQPPQLQPATPARAKQPVPGSAAATPRSSFSSTTTLPGTPGRAPPSHKPALPPSLPPTPAAARPTPAQTALSRSYRPVVDTLEELGTLVAPADMVSCLLAAAKQIYSTAKSYVEAHEAQRQAAAAASGGAGPPSKCEAMSADGFFPIFLFVLIQSAVPHWLHRLKAMQRWALLESEAMAEPAYYLTTLEAALIFVHQATPDNINPNKSERAPAPVTPVTPRARRVSGPVEAERAGADKVTESRDPDVNAAAVADSATTGSSTADSAVIPSKEDAPASASTAADGLSGVAEPTSSAASALAIPLQQQESVAAQPKSDSAASLSAPAARDDSASASAAPTPLSSSSPAALQNGGPVASASVTAVVSEADQPVALADPAASTSPPSALVNGSASDQRTPSQAQVEQLDAPLDIASDHSLFANAKNSPYSPLTHRFDANDL